MLDAVKQEKHFKAKRFFCIIKNISYSPYSISLQIIDKETEQTSISIGCLLRLEAYGFNSFLGFPLLKAKYYIKLYCK